MVDWKDKLRSRYYNVSDFVKRTAISTAVIATLTIGTVSADSGLGISTVYHVYVNGDRVGTVDNKQIVESYIENREIALKANNPTIDFGLEDNVVFIQEMVFRPNVNNQQVLNRLAENLEILAESTSILINDEPVAFVENQEQADEVLRLMKLKYVTEEELSTIENKGSNTTLLALEEGQSRILDVTFKEKVSISKQKISPAEMLTVEEAVTYLSKGALEEKKYQVQDGDVLGTIASKHDLNLAELLSLNPGLTEDSLIKPGQEMNVTALKPYLHVVIQEEVFKRENIPFTKEVKENEKRPKGENKVKQEGQNGEKLVNYLVSKENGNVIMRETITEEVVKEPVPEIIEKGTKVIPSRGTGSLAWPAVGGYISSKVGYRWGRMHNGIDIARPSNRNILAADNGVVTSARYDGSFGNKIVINHNNGIITIYAHLSDFSVGVGDIVERGQKIGVMGSTGNSTGLHLHFEVHKNGSMQNPLRYLN